MSKLYFGYTTMSHGLKGELKLYTDFSLKEKVLKKGFPIYIDGNGHKISSVRNHKNYFLVTFDEIFDINGIEPFRHKEIYIDEKDLELKGEVLLESLLDYSVFEEEMLGKVDHFLYNKGGILLKVVGSKSFYLPYNKEFIKQIDSDKKRIDVKNVRGYLI